MGEYVFQDLCRDLFDEEATVEACETYGVRGQSQDGIDLLAHRKDDDGIEVGQCKCYGNLTRSQIRKASDEFLDHWDHWSECNVKRFVLFVACGLGRREQQDEIIEQKKRFRSSGIKYEVWSAAKITKKLRPHQGIVAQYFQPADYWKQTICGVAPPTSPLTGAHEPQTLISVDTALICQLGGLTARVCSDVEQQFDAMRIRWREGYTAETAAWLANLKGDDATWPVLPAELRAKILCLEAGVQLDLTGDFGQARQLADEARTLAPADKQARLRALIAYRESGPEAAIQLLEAEEDRDSLNLKASLLLEMGHVDDCLGILDFEESEPESDVET